MSGEWNACETVSGVILAPSRASAVVMRLTASPGPDTTVEAGPLIAAIFRRLALLARTRSATWLVGRRLHSSHRPWTMLHHRARGQPRGRPLRRASTPRPARPPRTRPRCGRSGTSARHRGRAAPRRWRRPRTCRWRTGWLNDIAAANMVVSNPLGAAKVVSTAGCSCQVLAEGGRRGERLGSSRGTRAPVRCSSRPTRSRPPRRRAGSCARCPDPSRAPISSLRVPAAANRCLSDDLTLLLV